MPSAGIERLAEDFIRQRLALTALPFRPDIALFLPTPGSGLARFLAEIDRDDQPPYWAFAWAGGAALALHLQHHSTLVSGKSVLDFGAGSGLVGMAAAKAGAARVLAFEPDPVGKVACRLNAQANGVALEETPDPLVEADIVLAGDVFYDPAIAGAALSALRRHAARGASVLVGDPFRRHLPKTALALLAEYDVPDMGGTGTVHTGIFAMHPPAIGHADPALADRS